MRPRCRSRLESCRRAPIGRRSRSSSSSPPREATMPDRWPEELTLRRVRELEGELEQRESMWGRYARLYDDAPVAMLMLDRKGIIRLANRAAAVLLDYDQRTMLGKPFVVAARMLDAAPFWRHLERCLNELTTVTTNLELRIGKGDRRTVRLTSNALRDPSTAVMMTASALMDVGRRADAEREITLAHQKERRIRA